MTTTTLRFETHAHYVELLPCMHGLPMKPLAFAVFLACADPSTRLDDFQKVPS